MIEFSPQMVFEQVEHTHFPRGRQQIDERLVIDSTVERNRGV